MFITPNIVEVENNKMALTSLIIQLKQGKKVSQKGEEKILFDLFLIDLRLFDLKNGQQSVI